MGCAAEAPPVADEARRSAAAATQKIPSEQRLAMDFLMLQRASLDEDAAGSNPVTPTKGNTLIGAPFFIFKKASCDQSRFLLWVAPPKRCPLADEARRSAAAATQKTPSEHRLAMDFLMLQRASLDEDAAGSNPVTPTKHGKSELFRYGGTVRICFFTLIIRIKHYRREQPNKLLSAVFILHYQNRA